tara:strand:- start:718 stop:1272 length:555 start_codon:yes stop_codon:yes gene_type:complete
MTDIYMTEEKCYECGMCGGEGHICEDIKESIDRFIQMCKDRGMDVATAAEMMEEGYYKPLREEEEINAEIIARLEEESKTKDATIAVLVAELKTCSCDYDDEGELQFNGEAKFKCGSDYYCRLCAEFDNDVLVSGDCGYCTECLEWIPLTKFVLHGEVELSQPCRQCKYHWYNIAEHLHDLVVV